ncbi:leucine-rich repeat protein [Ruminococcus sp. HUN007]|uniref:leucine-rich repeat protein n=1 Tax=Ruminococcus sp. HUN007 TaxID=1514668 RepID=UPI0005D1CFD0|nr:leucine-rich repeat protein [Ruminococcus sp. HUN007]
MKLEIENGVLKKLDIVYFSDFDLDIVIPYGVTKIGYQAFEYGCRVKSITIPDTVTEIDDDAYR